MMRSVPNSNWDRSTPPPPSSIRSFDLPEVRTEALSSGLVVKSMGAVRFPLVSACLVMDAGEVLAPRGQEGVAVMTGDGLQGGTSQRSGPDLAEALERMGTGLRVATDWDATSVGFSCVAERLDETLALLSEVIREPTFPPEELERLRRQRLAAIEQRRLEPDLLAVDTLNRRIFGPEHPYRRPLIGESSTVEGLDDESVRAFASARHSPVGGGLVVVGDLSPTQVESMARRHFSAWAGPPKAEQAQPVLGDRGDRAVVLVHRPGAVQSEIRIGHEGPRRDHPDETALRVANAVLGGAFTSRLNLSLREERGFTYGVHSRFSSRKEGGAFTIGTAVQTEVTAAALGEAMDVFGKFVMEGPTTDELVRARDYLAGVFPLRMETTSQLASSLVDLVVYDLSDDHFHHARDRIRAVDAAEALRVVRTHMKPEQAEIVVVGDADRILQEITDLGLGPVEVVQR